MELHKVLLLRETMEKRKGMRYERERQGWAVKGTKRVREANELLN